jgi:hypothetical protein
MVSSRWPGEIDNVECVVTTRTMQLLGVPMNGGHVHGARRISSSHGGRPLLGADEIGRPIRAGPPPKSTYAPGLYTRRLMMLFGSLCVDNDVNNNSTVALLIRCL